MSSKPWLTRPQEYPFWSFVAAGEPTAEAARRVGLGVFSGKKIFRERGGVNPRMSPPGASTPATETRSPICGALRPARGADFRGKRRSVARPEEPRSPPPRIRHPLPATARCTTPLVRDVPHSLGSIRHWLRMPGGGNGSTLAL